MDWTIMRQIVAISNAGAQEVRCPPPRFKDMTL